MPGAASADWPLFAHDAARSGYAAGDTTISLANIRGLHRRWVAKLAAPADSAPILISNVRPRPARESAMLITTTRGGETYALDAHSGTVLWRFATHGPNVTSSMPAFDPTSQAVYVPGVDGFVHKLMASTGAEEQGGAFPLRITWMPDIEKDAAALNIANGFLYAVTSGYFGDYGHYVGHVVTVRLKDGSVRVFNSLCSNIPNLLREDRDQGGAGAFCPDARAGMWSRSGAVVDPDPSMHGRVYVTTGNGPFTANKNGHDYGDSVLALNAAGTTLEDYFTPVNFAQLEDGDMDLGSTAPVMLPREPKGRTPLMAIQGGKDGILRLLDREQLGGVGGAIQDFDLGEGIFSAPAVYRDADAVTWVFVGTSSATTGLQIATDASGKSTLRQRWKTRLSATSPVVANGVVFVASSDGLDALAARTGKLAWSSSEASAGGTIGHIHWQSPIVAGAWVYISDETGNLTAYSL